MSARHYCHHCGQLYFSDHPRAKYCGKKCRQAHAALLLKARKRAPAKRLKKCRACQQPFLPVVPQAWYCSRACQLAMHRAYYHRKMAADPAFRDKVRAQNRKNFRTWYAKPANRARHNAAALRHYYRRKALARLR